MLSREELEKYREIDLTPDVLRKFKGCEHFSHEEAEQVLEITKVMAEIAQQNIDNEDFLKLFEDK